MKFRTSKKLFAHIDCDSFFASCEIFANPGLKGKYVCVGSEIIVAASYNAKKKGIKVGTPIWQAKEILGNKGVFTGLNFELYGELSRALMKYLGENTLSVEKFSIDEAFCEITGLSELYKLTTTEYVKRLQTDIKKQVGIPVSIGVSNTRIKAKIFSDLNKPYGIFVGNETKNEYEIFKKVPFGDIPFAGRKSQKRFQYRCHTISDFLGLGFWNLKKEVGKSMTSLRLELHGVNAWRVRSDTHAKSISRSRSFNKKKTCNQTFLMNQALGHFETVYTWVTQKSLEVKEISLMLRDENFNTHRLSYHFPEHTNDRKKILQELKVLFPKLYNSQLKYRSTGVTCFGLRSYLPRQMSIFDMEFQTKDKAYELSRVINYLNQKYAGQKLAFGKELVGRKLSEKIFIRS